MNGKPLKLGDIQNKDLAGWQHTTGHFAQLAHGLMGAFPVVINETDEMVICTDKVVLLDVLEKLRIREFNFGELPMLVSPDKKFGFIMARDNVKDTEATHILTREEFETRVVNEEEPFHWPYGLISLKPEPTKEEFEKIIAKERAKCA
ncbi:MAG: hypothetical protein ABH884_01685 [Candidatus Komeilibacteria bacterium]